MDEYLRMLMLGNKQDLYSKSLIGNMSSNFNNSLSLSKLKTTDQLKLFNTSKKLTDPLTSSADLGFKPSTIWSNTTPKLIANGTNPEVAKTNVGNIVGSVADFVPKYMSENKTANAANSLYDAASSAVMAVNPLIGGIMKGAGATYDLINNMTNGAIAVDNKKSGAVAGIDNVLSSKILGLTPIGLANSLTKTKIEGSDADISKNITAGYQANNVESNEFGGISRLFNKKGIKATQSNASNTNTQNILKSSAITNSRKNEEMARNNISNVINKNYLQQQGGVSTNQLRTISAKNGIKLLDLKNIKNTAIYRAKKGMKIPELETKKEDFNLIPDGALHGRKNNLPEDLAEVLTNKGIPVVSGLNSNNLQQHAEIEKNEIIFHKKLTTEIEKLYKKYKENENDDILIEAGKLLAYEILENTNDNTGILNTN